MLNVPTYNRTKIPAAPETSPYYAPLPDYGRIQFFTQGAAATGARKLRMGLNQALQAGRRQENPNVMGLLNRQALSGYGEGLESVMGGARREGMGLYAPEFAAMTEQEKMNWLAQQKKGLLDYEAIMNAYGENKPPTMSSGSTARGYTQQPTRSPLEGGILPAGMGQDVLSWGGGGQPSTSYTESPFNYENFASGWFNR